MILDVRSEANTYDEVEYMVGAEGFSGLGSDEHRFLWDQLKLAGAGCRYLEIGVYFGATVIVAAKAGAEVTAVDNWAAKNRELFLMNIKNPKIGIESQVHVMDGMGSDEAYAHLAGGEQFDAILVDGLHDGEQPYRDLVNYSTLIKPGGLIMADDVALDVLEAIERWGPEDHGFTLEWETPVSGKLRAYRARGI